METGKKKTVKKYRSLEIYRQLTSPTSSLVCDSDSDNCKATSVASETDDQHNQLRHKNVNIKNDCGRRKKKSLLFKSISTIHHPNLSDMDLQVKGQKWTDFDRDEKIFWKLVKTLGATGLLILKLGNQFPVSYPHYSIKVL
jgi:hypothetical protein